MQYKGCTLKRGHLYKVSLKIPFPVNAFCIAIFRRKRNFIHYEWIPIASSYGGILFGRIQWNDEDILKIEPITVKDLPLYLDLHKSDTFFKLLKG